MIISGRLLFCLVAVTFMVSGCSKLIRKHQDFMDALKTKSDVIQHFGQPNQYRSDGSTSEWLYKLDDQKKVTTSNPDPVSKKLNTTKGMAVEQFQELSGKYVLIAFENDSVVNRQSLGVNYSIREVNPVQSVLLGAGLAVVIAVVLYGMAYSGTL